MFGNYVTDKRTNTTIFLYIDDDEPETIWEDYDLLSTIIVECSECGRVESYDRDSIEDIEEDFSLNHDDLCVDCALAVDEEYDEYIENLNWEYMNSRGPL